MSAVPSPRQRGAWRLPPGVSITGCTPVSGSTIVFPFDEAVSDEINTTYFQNTESNNLIDMTGYGASKPAGVWVQRSGGTNSFKGSISGSTLSLNGVISITVPANNGTGYTGTPTVSLAVVRALQIQLQLPISSGDHDSVTVTSPGTCLTVPTVNISGTLTGETATPAFITGTSYWIRDKYSTPARRTCRPL